MEIGSINLPLSSIGWLVGGIAIWIYAWRSWRHYKTTGNPIAKFSSLWAASFGLVCFTALTPVFTLDRQILLISFDIATFGALFTVNVLAYQLWFSWLRPYMPWWLPMLITIPLSVCILVLTITTTGLVISQNPLVIKNVDTQLVTILRVVLYNLVTIPFSILMIRQAIHSSYWGTRLKMGTIGATVAVVMLAYSAGLLFGEYHSAIPLAVIGTVLVSFVLLGLVLLFVPKQKKSN